jgi:hypothetical protein
VKQLFKLSLVFFVFLSIVVQSLSFYIPSFNEEISEIVLIEFDEENDEPLTPFFDQLGYSNINAI